MAKNEAFAKAVEQRKAAKAAQDMGASSGLNYGALETGKFKQVRLLGNPLEGRGPLDAKMASIAWIVDDNGKWFKCSFDLDRNWILNKAIAKVMAYKWNAATNSPDYIHTDKESFIMVSKNGTPDNKFSSGWKPKKHIVMNIIDRSRMDWHKENKQTLLFSSKVSTKETDDGTVYRYADGVPQTLYNKVFDEITSYAGDWNDYDIVAKKLTESPWYIVYHAEQDKVKFKELMPDFLEEYAEKPLTEEELSWERVNLDEAIEVTPYKTIMYRLGESLQKIDKDFDSNLYTELESLVVAEADKAAKTNESGSQAPQAVAPASTPVSAPVQDTALPLPEVKEEVKAAVKPKAVEPVVAKVRERKAAPAVQGDGPSLREQLKAFKYKEDLFSDEELSQIKSVDAEGKVTWKDDLELMSCLNTGCPFPSPETVNHCLSCGELF